MQYAYPVFLKTISSHERKKRLESFWIYRKWREKFPFSFFPLFTACFFLSAFDILRFFLGGAILKCYMILLMRTLAGNSTA